MPQISTVYTSASDQSRYGYLLKSNYLSEFSSLVDKARVRYNLGIPDSYSLVWGNITGSIANQTDLVNYLTLVKADIKSSTSDTTTAVTNLLESVSALTANATTSSTKIMNLCTLVQTLEEALEELKATATTLSANAATISDLKTDIALNAAQIALNATKIADLGGNTDLSLLSNHVNELEEEVDTIKAYQSSLLNLITLINTNTTDISSIKTSVLTNTSLINSLSSSISGYDLSALSARISALESKVGTVSVTEIRLNYTSITDVTLSSEARSIVVTAVYSNGTTADVTEQCTLTSNAPTIVLCNNTNKSISFVGVGTTKVSVAYSSFVKYIDVTVASETVTTMQYIGYADDYTDLFRTGGKSTVIGTWSQDNTPDVHTADVYGFWIITTEEISTVSEIGTYNLSDISKGTCTYEGTTYNVYMVGPTLSSDLTINIS